jgi:hypothetical protein
MLNRLILGPNYWLSYLHHAPPLTISKLGLEKRKRDFFIAIPSLFGKDETVGDVKINGCEYTKPVGHPVPYL